MLILEPTLYKKGAWGPRGPVGPGAEKRQQPQALGPQPLPVYRWDRVVTLLPVFIKRKPASHPGLQGVTPWHVFAFFLRVKKEGGPQARPEKDEYSGLPAHTMRLYFKCAPEPPGNRPIFSS